MLPSHLRSDDPPYKDIEALEEGVNRVLKLFRPNGKLSDLIKSRAANFKLFIPGQ